MQVFACAGAAEAHTIRLKGATERLRPERLSPHVSEKKSERFERSGKANPKKSPGCFPK